MGCFLVVNCTLLASVATMNARPLLHRAQSNADLDPSSEIPGRRGPRRAVARSVACPEGFAGGTKGYKHHPQLIRFQAMPDPPAAIAAFLGRVHDEADHREYRFDATKIAAPQFAGTIEETEGQLLYEWRHLNEKLKRRAPERYEAHRSILIPLPHPLFRIVPGDVQAWERVQM